MKKYILYFYSFALALQLKLKVLGNFRNKPVLSQLALIKVTDRGGLIVLEILLLEHAYLMIL